MSHPPTLEITFLRCRKLLLKARSSSKHSTKCSPMSHMSQEIHTRQCYCTVFTSLCCCCKRCRCTRLYQVSSRKQVTLHPSSVLFHARPNYVVFTELVQTTKCYMRFAAVSVWRFRSADNSVSFYVKHVDCGFGLCLAGPRSPRKLELVKLCV